MGACVAGWCLLHENMAFLPLISLSEHDDMLWGFVCAKPRGQGWRGNAWDVTFVEKISQANLSGSNLSRAKALSAFFQQQVYLQPSFI